MVSNSYRYVKNIVDGEKFLSDTGNQYIFVSQSTFKGKLSEDGNTFILPPGVNLTLQIIKDNSEPIMDKDTGRVKDNNVLNTFDVTIPDMAFPVDANKGDYVRLGNFLEDYSYYVNFQLILRFGSVEFSPRKSGKNNDHQD